ncbi:MAG: phosphate signaling complex protein PhoU [Bacteroidota bacterium]
MHRHFEHALDALKTDIIRMSSLAEQAIAGSIRALLERKPELARDIISNDDQINLMEVRIDDAVVDLLALQQPVASDLRLILAALKINNDLERIGDHAVNIAESAVQCAEHEPIKPFEDITEMARITKEMLRDSIDAFIHSDPEKSRQVLANDDSIDALNKKVVSDLVGVMREHPDRIEHALDLIRVSRNLERVADLATNIAEEVIFIAEAQVVKHHLDKRGAWH